MCAYSDGMTTRQIRPATDPSIEVWTAGLNQFAESVSAVLQKIGDWFTRALASLRVPLITVANGEVHVAGLETQYLVRAGADPAYATPQDRDALIWEILTGEAVGTRLLTPRNRSLVAAAALRGWVGHYDTEPADALAWHRLIGATALEVSRG